MGSDPSTTRTRRAILGAALGGAAAVAATSVRPLAVRAADGGNALLGNANTATAPTSFENTDPGEVSLIGTHGAAGTGAKGSSVTGVGVIGASTDSTPSNFTTDPSHRTGVLGTTGDTTNAATITDEVGVYGFADVSPDSAGVWGDAPQGFGVYGSGSMGVIGVGEWGVYGTGSLGVVGDAGLTGVGVYGWTGNADPPAPPAGVGVYARAETTAQTALQVVGKARFSRSGRTSLGSTATSRKITMAGVTSSSYVIATMQTNVSGLYVRAVACTTGSFTIYLSKAPGKTVHVGYLVIN